MSQHCQGLPLALHWRSCFLPALQLATHKRVSLSLHDSMFEAMTSVSSINLCCLLVMQHKVSEVQQLLHCIADLCVKTILCVTCFH